MIVSGIAPSGFSNHGVTTPLRLLARLGRVFFTCTVVAFAILKSLKRITTSALIPKAGGSSGSALYSNDYNYYMQDDSALLGTPPESDMHLDDEEVPPTHLHKRAFFCIFTHTKFTCAHASTNARTQKEVSFIKQDFEVDQQNQLARFAEDKQHQTVISRFSFYSSNIFLNSISCCLTSFTSLIYFLVRLKLLSRRTRVLLPSYDGHFA
jgi:hypothetical protein